MKWPKWLRWSSGNETADTPSQDIKAVRRRTDQKIRQQEIQRQQPADDPQKEKRPDPADEAQKEQRPD